MDSVSVSIYKIYCALLHTYGPQGWWPLIGYNGTNPTKTGAINGYHVGDYTFPRTRDERFEICLGCILTQNTTWTSVERSLHNLKELDALSSERIMMLDDDVFKNAIRPSGYHNQKARYIKAFISFFHALGDDGVPTRAELLSCIGIGPETADSMLLYAFKQPEFVVDAYTRRIFTRLGLIDERLKYEDIKKMCESAFAHTIKNTHDLTIVYQECHALLVEHAKRHYGKKPYGVNCWLKSMCGVM